MGRTNRGPTSTTSKVRPGSLFLRTVLQPPFTESSPTQATKVGGSALHDLRLLLP
jgi:hypothetical protein